MPTPVTDSRSNANDQIDHAVKAIGRSEDRLAVFEAIYHGKGRKTPETIAARAGIKRKRVLEEAIKLLPTPTAHERTHTPRLVDHGRQLANEVALLPTPTEGDSRNSRNATANSGRGSTGHSGTTLSDVVYEWSGALTSRLSGGGRPSLAQRLSSSFVEWMIGAPAGWSDPDCPLSATEFKSSWKPSSAPTSPACWCRACWSRSSSPRGV